MQVFFCKYNDPIYVKMEKLEIMIKLASDRNIDQVWRNSLLMLIVSELGSMNIRFRGNLFHVPSIFEI